MLWPYHIRISHHDQGRRGDTANHFWGNVLELAHPSHRLVVHQLQVLRLWCHRQVSLLQRLGHGLEAGGIDQFP
ncbi:hypothetical protein D3C81_2270790 [compost metagenome]